MENHTSDQEKITALQNAYMKEQVKKAQAMQKQVIYRRRRLAIIFSIAAVVFTLMGWNLYHNYRQMDKLQAEAQEVKQEQQQVAEEKKQLEAKVSLLKDEDYVAKLARQKYYWSKDGETIYRYPGSEVEE